MQKVWITGAAGQIGTAINDVLDPLSMEILNTDLDELDITQTDEVLNFGAVNRPNIIINCAAVTDVALWESRSGQRQLPEAHRFWQLPECG